MKFKYKIVTTFFLFMVQGYTVASVYKCDVDGVTSYSQTPCENGNESIGLYQPSQPSMTFKSLDSSGPIIEDKKKPVNTMDAGDAISVKQGQCNRDSYSGVIKNFSSYSTYTATIEVKFKYYKKGMEKKDWDSKKKSFKLKPRQSSNFVIKGRPAPTSYKIECEISRSVKFIDSTVTK
jgi:hypothetical protein|tara:strand:+ start:7601 stop:8134 length:534 start_codon:yes stop_codon:yes gene_type:complete